MKKQRGKSRESAGRIGRPGKMPTLGRRHFKIEIRFCLEKLSFLAMELA